MQQIKVILVDDHQLFLEGLKATLNKEEDIVVVQIFNNALNALSFLKIETVDLVITDISMPDLNGIEFIKGLKKINSAIKTLAISMFKPIHYEKDFYNGYLLKESDSSIVIKAIKSIVIDNKPFFLHEKKVINAFHFSNKIVTKREREIIILISEELTVDEIASQLFLSRHTVETHKKNIFLKLHVKTNTGLVKKAIQLGYIS